MAETEAIELEMDRTKARVAERIDAITIKKAILAAHALVPGNTYKGFGVRPATPIHAGAHMLDIPRKAAQ
jgi:hypothetical protein